MKAKNLLGGLFGLLLSLATIGGAEAQYANGKAEASPAATTVDPSVVPLSLDLNHNLRVIAAAGGSAGIGNCVYNTTLPTYSTSQTTQCQSNNGGAALVGVGGLSGTGSDALSNNNVIFPYSVIGGTNQITTRTGLSVAPLVYNGTTWDRNFTCSNSAIINVTAAATTQLVALSASTVIRVCSFVLTESLAGTAKFVYGTDANCATGTTDLTGVMALSTSGNISISGMRGSLFRTAAANALCLTAVTGNITGFVTYAQF